MTATPIPRTVAMTVFGDLDVSTLTELPSGRAPIVTARRPGRREAALPRARLGAGPRGGREGPPGLRRVPAHRRRPGRPDGGEEEAEDVPDLRLVPDVPSRAPEDRPAAGGRRARAWPTCSATGRWRVFGSSVLHGRMPADEKDAVMRPFAAGEIDVLVATTVIEVGVDVANATAMVVMDADRFGVSQLHQLRGRVGRGAAPGPVPAGHRRARRRAGTRTAGRRRGDP